MSDNVPITPGTGAVIATDDVAGVQFQKIKLDVGGDGVSLPLSPTNPLPVALAGTTPVSLAAPIALDAASLAALETISIGNFPATQPVSLAAPVALDAASLAALETISVANFPATQPVSLAAPVALDAASLAALETIQIGNFPATQPVSLAAPVALDAASLAALEVISLGTPVSLDTAAMTALAAAATPATQPVSGPLTNAQMRAAPVPVDLAAPTNVTTTAYAKSLVLKAGPGVLYGLSGFNSKTTAQFIQLHDATAEPGANAVPKVLVQAAASSPFTFDFGPRGRAFATGIVVCNSSTGPTATVGAADCWFDGQVA